MKDLLPFGWDSNSLPVEPSKHLPLLIITGSFEEPVELMRIKVMRPAFHAYIGWELKDCVEMGLPDRMRNLVLKKMQRVVKYGVEGYVLLVQR